MKTLIIIIGLLCVAVECFVGPGCGTLMNRAGNNPERPYGGVRSDLSDMGDPFRKKEGPGGLDYALLPVLCIDLVFCAVADTVMLPSDLWPEKAPAKTEPKPK